MFTTLFIQPLFNILISIYNYLPWHDIGIATIILTAAVRLLLYPLYQKSAAAQIKINSLQPKIKEIQEKYKGNFKEKAEAIQKIYQENKVSPFSGFLLLLIQIPIMFALYKIFINGFSSERLGELLYPFVDKPGIINKTLINTIDISEKNIALAGLTALAQFFQTKSLTPKTPKETAQNYNSSQNNTTKFDFSQEFSKMLAKQMLYMGPILTFLILSKLPAILAIYWLTNTLFSWIQQYFIKRKLAKTS